MSVTNASRNGSVHPRDLISTYPDSDFEILNLRLEGRARTSNYTQFKCLSLATFLEVLSQHRLPPILSMRRLYFLSVRLMHFSINHLILVTFAKYRTPKRCSCTETQVLV